MTRACIYIGADSETADGMRAETVDQQLVETTPAAKPARRARTAQVPSEILEDPLLLKRIKDTLPWNYEFEIPKTIWRIKSEKATCVALQFPEGLLLFAHVIADIIQDYCGVETVIMGDVTYGACCIDDFSAKALGCDFLVHYGHSCLIPIDKTSIGVMYVFVEIDIDIVHLVQTIKMNFGGRKKVVIAGTIQFSRAVQNLCASLREETFIEVVCPQERPLSKAEVLGCTAPSLTVGDQVDCAIFVADGRFHLEALMVANAKSIPEFYLYNPYSKEVTREEYDFDAMMEIRHDAVKQAQERLVEPNPRVGLILGTLGRQGNPDVLGRLESMLKEQNIDYTIILLSEIFPSKLALFSGISFWVQVACPRLSMDWGYAFPQPLLTAYELTTALEYNKTVWNHTMYPMDNYSRGTRGPWGNYYTDRKKAPATASSTLSAKERIRLARATRKKVAVQYQE